MSAKGSSIQVSQAHGKGNPINEVARKRVFYGNCGFRLPKRSELSPLKFLKNLGGKTARGLSLMSMRKRRHPPKAPSSSSSSTTTTGGRSKPLVAPFDSRRSEAIEDCIEFINSSSLPRSNSVSATPC